MAQPLHHHQPSADRRSRHRHVRGGRNADQPAAARRLDRAGTAGRTAGASHQLSRIAGAGPPLAYASWRMRRFYKQVEARAERAGHAILLDGRLVHTPAKAALRVPTAQLADAIASEWEEQGDRIDPRSMPLTGLANAAID